MDRVSWHRDKCVTWNEDLIGVDTTRRSQSGRPAGTGGLRRRGSQTVQSRYRIDLVFVYVRPFFLPSGNLSPDQTLELAIALGVFSMEVKSELLVSIWDVKGWD